MKYNRPIAFFVILLGLWSSNAALASNERWFNVEQVSEGEKLFLENCASCHGNKAQGTTEWKKRDDAGNYPPPPLNGSAHAWHHPINQLRRTVQGGGKKLGGTMPPFKDKLNAAEIDLVISYFQSMWNDEIYKAWEGRHTTGELPKAKKVTRKSESVSKNSKPDNTRFLAGLVEGESIETPTRTAIDKILQVKVGKDFIYLTEDGRYAITGDLIDLQSGSNLTEQARSTANLNLLEEFPDAKMVVYSAKGAQRSMVTVFTDTSCPYCRKLHSDVPTLQEAGVAVRYIPFPRGGMRGDGYGDLVSIWCADNPQAAMDIAHKLSPGKLEAKTCDIGKAVDEGYQLGIDLGIRGTPALFLPDGRKIEGYQPAKRLLKTLGLSS